MCLVLVTNDHIGHVSCTPVMPSLNVLLISQLAFVVLTEVMGGFPLTAEVSFYVIQRPFEEVTSKLRSIR